MQDIDESTAQGAVRTSRGTDGKREETAALAKGECEEGVPAKMGLPCQVKMVLWI